MIIFKQFTFDSAHFLPMVPEGHKCREIHGHTYKLTIFIEGSVDPILGWVSDFSDIKIAVGNTLSVVDHKLLNNISGLENPTVEHVIKWLWDRFKRDMPGLSRIELYETPSSGAIYDGK